MPLSREQIIPFFSVNTEVLSLRGNQCLTLYDYSTQELRIPFTPSFNAFLNAINSSEIRALNLANCHLGDLGAQYLAEVLYINTTLLCLCLSGNRIGDVGAEALASSLSFRALSPPELEIVNLLINDEAKHKLPEEGPLTGKRFGKRRVIRSIDKTKFKGKKSNEDKFINFDWNAPCCSILLKKWNDLIEGGVNQKLLPGNGVLTTLILDENMIGMDGYHALKEMLSLNNVLVNFSMSRNTGISEELAESIGRRKHVN
jgi:hypothetical protein